MVFVLISKIGQSMQGKGLFIDVEQDYVNECY